MASATLSALTRTQMFLLFCGYTCHCSCSGDSQAKQTKFIKKTHFEVRELLSIQGKTGRKESNFKKNFLLDSLSFG